MPCRRMGYQYNGFIQYSRPHDTEWMPRGRGLATATTSASLLPHFEQRRRGASDANVADRPTSRASASGSMWREAPQGQVTRTRNCPSASSSFFM